MDEEKNTDREPCIFVGDYTIYPVDSRYRVLLCLECPRYTEADERSIICVDDLASAFETGHFLAVVQYKAYFVDSFLKHLEEELGMELVVREANDILWAISMQLNCALDRGVTYKEFSNYCDERDYRNGYEKRVEDMLSALLEGYEESDDSEE